MKTIVSIGFAAAIMLMPEAGFRSPPGVRSATRTSSLGQQQAYDITPRMPDDSTDNIYRDLERAKTVFEFYQRRGGAVCWIDNDLSACFHKIIISTNWK
jgi:hypothetical protein